MDIGKENKRVQVKSKIPLPKDPLPPLSQTLIKRPQELDIERHPLKTINWQTINKPNITGANPKIENSERNNLKTKCPLKVDTRHVTLRQNTEDLDWNYQVFKDNEVKECSSVIIISNEEKENEERIDEERSKQKNCLGDTKKALTPSIKSPLLEPNKIKNIKRSLKRPHSRELQGISPKVQQDRRDERHKRRLEFTQFSQYQLHSPDFLEKSYMTCLNRDYTEDLFTYLLNIEKRTVVPRISSKIRACIINWLIKVNGLNGNPAVIQTAQLYFDAVLAVSHVQMNSLQLVAAACYWIAQKIHGPAFSARRLVKYSSEAFTVRNLLSAEKAVMYKLKFPSQPVTPQEFVTYFSWYCDSCHFGEIEVAATFLCMAGLMVDKSLCNEYPSVIGVASVRNAVLLLRRKDAMVRLHMNSVYKAAESKVSSISSICSIQRKAIRCMSSPYFKYKAPLEYYGIGPHFIAQKVINSANELSLVE
ncbi:unnamed protein product, partial [Brenthis ino]